MSQLFHRAIQRMWWEQNAKAARLENILDEIFLSSTFLMWISLWFGVYQSTRAGHAFHLMSPGFFYIRQQHKSKHQASVFNRTVALKRSMDRSQVLISSQVFPVIKWQEEKLLKILCLACFLHKIRFIIIYQIHFDFSKKHVKLDSFLLKTNNNNLNTKSLFSPQMCWCLK